MTEMEKLGREAEWNLLRGRRLFPLKAEVIRGQEGGQASSAFRRPATQIETSHARTVSGGRRLRTLSRRRRGESILSEGSAVPGIDRTPPAKFIVGNHREREGEVARKGKVGVGVGEG